MISEDKRKVLDLYAIGLAAYKKQSWDEALKAFNEAHKIDPNDGPTKVYIERCSHFRENPPDEDWDGVFTMTTK